MDKTVVLSLGGSLIVPDEVDTGFLKGFLDLVRRYVDDGYKFVIVCGGGRTARRYQEAAKDISGLDNEQLDWIGIEATKLNAYLMTKLLGGLARETHVTDPTQKVEFDRPVIVASGWKPGWSTDYDAVMLGKAVGAEVVVNMSNVEHVHDKDPKQHKDAKPLTEISWEEYRKLVGDEWTAGLNTPFDPIASREAQKAGIKAAIMGKDLGNLEKFLKGEKFEGTVIQ